MDTFDIAKLMMPHEPRGRLGIRYGVATSVGPGNALGFRPDGETGEVPCVRCCNPQVGDRVVVMVNDTEWLALAVVGDSGGGDPGGGGSGGAGAWGLPSVERAGVVLVYAGTAAPPGYLMCDGAAYSRAEYAELFEAIGTRYGSGDGSATFNVPDLAGRVALGTGGGYVLGSAGGEAEHVLLPGEMPAHAHGVNQRTASSGTGEGTVRGLMNAYDANPPDWLWTDPAWATPQTAIAGESQPHNNLQPYLSLNYVISTGKAAVFADYVVERGSSGVWTWEKWESGKASCTMVGSGYEVSGSAWNGFYLQQVDIPYPFAFSGYPHLEVQAKVGTGVTLAFSASLSKTAACIGMASSQNGSAWVTARAEGEWR